MLNYEEIGKHAERITKIKHLKININAKELIFHHRKTIGKKLRKIM